MIASQTDTHVRDNLILKLMELPNKTVSLLLLRPLLRFVWWLDEC
jgi:hypothetical protein